ncbi:MAG: prolyl aminopeptidase [Bdellovibrionales bacterium]|nr:prolyl aminopeptidase [Bdellovibrionales bacterium]
MKILYPEIEPRLTGTLPVSELHTLYYEECGNPRGKPVVFLHGGPGGGIEAKHRRFFSPEKYRIILFDQRGCGKSTPFAELRDNTTWDLVSDMESLREHLRIESWQVFGGSWGSTLALAYAVTHPERVSELVLRGIFLLRDWEIQWFYQEGASRMFPEAWREYLKPIPKGERGDLVAAYHRRLVSLDEEERLEAAKAWSIWEGSTSQLRPDPKFIEHFAADRFALAFARIECHYFVNGGWLREKPLLSQAARLAKIPGVIVQGRYDVVCPPQSAWELHQAWPDSELRVVGDAGHSAFEAGITHELVSATDRYADR